MILLKQSTTFNLPVLMVDSTDHITGKTGLTLTITASKDGAAFASITPTVTELATGWYKLALTTGNTDTLGMLAIHITASGADPLDMICQVFASTFDTLVRSTTPANTLDVSATGEAGLDFANIKLATGSTTLTNIIVPTVTTVTTTTSVTNDVGITQAGADKVWGTTTRTLSSFGTLVSDIWANATRTLSAFGFTVATNSDSNVTAIKAKTDLLPSNPASQTNLDVAVSTRLAGSSYTTPPTASDIATAVWGATTRTLSSFGTLVSDIWANATRTLTASGGITAQEVWEYATRTITSGTITAQQVWEYTTRSLTDKIDFLLTSAYDAAKTASTQASVSAIPTNPLLTNDIRLANLDAKISTRSELTAVGVWNNPVRTLTSGSTVAISSISSAVDTEPVLLIKGDTFSYSFQNIDLEGFTKLYFTLKKNYKDEDCDSIIQIDSEDGILYLNGQKKTVGTGATITGNESTSIVTLTITPSITKQFAYSINQYYFDVQVIKTTTVSTPKIGVMEIIRDVTQKTV